MADLLGAGVIAFSGVAVFAEAEGIAPLLLDEPHLRYAPARAQPLSSVGCGNGNLSPMIEEQSVTHVLKTTCYPCAKTSRCCHPCRDVEFRFARFPVVSLNAPALMPTASRRQRLPQTEELALWWCDQSRTTEEPALDI